MNTENNERYKDTENKIMHAYGRLAFEKSIDKITVSDVCKEAQIHRTTFYGHFQDMLELETVVTVRQFRQLLEDFVTEDGWDLREGILVELRFFYDHQSMIKRNFSNFASAEHVDQIFADAISSDFAESYKKHFRLHSDLEMAYHQAFIGSGALAIIKKWVLSGCRETPETIADIICDIL